MTTTQLREYVQRLFYVSVTVSILFVIAGVFSITVDIASWVTAVMLAQIYHLICAAHGHCVKEIITKYTKPKIVLTAGVITLYCFEAAISGNVNWSNLLVATLVTSNTYMLAMSLTHERKKK